MPNASVTSSNNSHLFIVNPGAGLFISLNPLTSSEMQRIFSFPAH
jgi:hypothetical protein